MFVQIPFWIGALWSLISKGTLQSPYLYGFLKPMSALQSPFCIGALWNPLYMCKGHRGFTKTLLYRNFVKPLSTGFVKPLGDLQATSV